MLATALPQVARDGSAYHGEMLEAFAYTYLGSYAAGSFDSSILEGYRKAWGHDELYMFNAMDSDTPEFCMAIFKFQDPVKVVIGIRGITGIGALTRFLRDPSSQSISGLPGRVYTTYKDGAANILNTVLTHPGFIAATFGKRVSITFAGYSFGAALAEICGEMTAKADPAKEVKVFKFGSPRVGDHNWNAGRATSIARRCIYCHGDPIFCFPNQSYSSTWAPFVPGSSLLLQTYYVRDTESERWTWDQFREFDYGSAFTENQLQLGIQFPNGPWIYHSMNMYRLMFARWVAQEEILLKYRFCYLEHPDENQFQVKFNLTRGTDTTGMFVIGTAPAAQEVPFGLLPHVRDTDVGGGGGGEGDDAIPPPTLLGPAAVPENLPAWNSAPPRVRVRSRVG